MAEKDSEKIEKLKETQAVFRKKMAVLKSKKQALFSKFRSKLEEKKIEEIQQKMDSAS